MKKIAGKTPVDLYADHTQRNVLHKKIVTGFVIVYLGIQMLIPLRHWLYPDHPSWSFEGARFSWRLKLNTKIVHLDVIVTDPQTNQVYHVDYRHFVTPRQLWLDNIPDMMLQFVYYIEKEFQTIGVKDPVIRIKAEASFNERPFQPYIDDRVDLTHINYRLFEHAAWIIPLDPQSRPQVSNP